MELVCTGNHEAFAELVRRHTDQFLILADRVLESRVDAEDIIQAAFVKLWQNPAAWDAEKSRFTTWFYKVVLNACHDFLRKNQRRILLDGPKLEAMLLPSDSEQEILEARQDAAQRRCDLQNAMNDLPGSQRDALNLVVYSALPQKQAAEIMGIGLKALESLLSRARKSLAQKIGARKTGSKQQTGAVKGETNRLRA